MPDGDRAAVACSLCGEAGTGVRNDCILGCNMVVICGRCGVEGAFGRQQVCGCLHRSPPHGRTCTPPVQLRPLLGSHNGCWLLCSNRGSSSGLLRLEGGMRCAHAATRMAHTSHFAVVPHRGVLPHSDIAHDGGVGRHECCARNLGRMQARACHGRMPRDCNGRGQEGAGDRGPRSQAAPQHALGPVLHSRSSWKELMP